MKVRLALAAAATCLAVFAPTLHPSANPSTPIAPVKILTGTMVDVHAVARLGAAAAPEAAPERWLRTADGKAYQLHFTAQPALDTRSVRITGTVAGNQVNVASAVPTTSTYSTTGATRTGTRSVLIMMINWTHPDATTPQAANTQVGFTTSNWFRSVSHGKLAFAARTTPWMSVPTQDCTLATGGYWKVLAAAEKAAIARGYNPKGYNHEMVYFPFDAKCNYGGLGSVNDRQSWVNGEMDSRVANHELGHNLGLNHGRSAICVDGANRQVTLSSKCTTDEYGDIFDTMGVPLVGTPDFSALQQDHLGWITGHVAAPTKSTTITLAPLETNSGTLAARIRSGGAEYWVEYRQPVGVDATMRMTPGATDGVLIHRVGADGGTDLLDARPDTSRGFTNAALPLGRTWTSPQRMTVKVISLSSSRAVVSIGMP